MAFRFLSTWLRWSNEVANLDEVVNAATDVIRCRTALAVCKEQIERLFKERHVHQDNLDLAEKKLRAVCDPPVPEKKKRAK